MASGVCTDVKVLVTGASGYIAAHVVKCLIEAGYKVRGTVRSQQDDIKVEPILDLGTDMNPVELVVADLLNESSWLPAVRDCQYVIHVASPFPINQPLHEDDLLKPAIEGTLSLLKACRDAGCVKRVVLTSSTAAINSTEGLWTEESWCDPTAVNAYTKSKILAEKAAWDFVQNLPEDSAFELAVMNPGAVIGPNISSSCASSIEILRQIMTRQIPLIPKVGFAFIDVRDVALAHLNAMTIPEAAGHRHILTCKFMMMKDIALILQGEFASQGYNVPTKELPSAVVKFGALFVKQMKLMVPFLDKQVNFDNSRMVNVLGVVGRDSKASTTDTIYKMIEDGLIPKTDAYRGPRYSE